ncbi:hypothetical protein Daus18300_002397 [Diaporthe australafricana]|uniref:Heterokaryon incompatibility domain-containing protein n=1 Tax=Diaporthe australafricana TaxID=127596 RepID=A0ABR3XN52_9PEZI
MPRFYWHPQRPKTSADVFQVEQQLWGILARDRASYRRRRAAEPRGPSSPLYTPLDEQRREVRLLEVSRPAQSDGQESTVAARLVQAALDDNPTYLAISYAWGEASVAGYFCDPDGIETRLGYSKVTLEIVSTLVAPGSTLYLWIDSVCINQEDNDERASQVAIMGDIYRQAQQVVIFLGTADETTTHAMDLLQLTRGFINAKGDILPPMSIDDFEKLSRGAGLNPTYWAAVAHLILRPWFTRYWTIQEAALAPDAMVVCGRHAVSWEELRQVCQWVVDNNGVLFGVMERHHAVGAPMAHLEAPFRNPLSIAVARGIQGAEKDPTTLQQLLLRFRHFRCADPRDRIFALLGLGAPTDRDEHEFRPNYRIGAEDLYIQVTRRILMRDPEVIILAAAGVGHKRSLRLPSWVPDWTSFTEGMTLDEIAATGNYHATEEDTKPIVSYDPQTPSTITITGCVVDTIAQVSSERLALGREGRLRYVQDTAAWIEEVLEMAGLADTLISAQPQDDTRKQIQKTHLWKTLTASGPGAATPQTVPRGRGPTKQPRGGTTGRRPPPTERGFDNWLAERRQCAAAGSLDGLQLGRAAREEVSAFAYHCACATRGGRFFVSLGGHLGLAPAGAEVGDAVCVFPGIRTPFAVRRVGLGGGGGGYGESLAGVDCVLVGEVYHSGVVSGEVGLYPPSEPIRLV